MPTLQFKGKALVKNYHFNVKYHQLIPDKDKSLTDTVSLHDNLIIQGDNLKALKALLPTYGGKVKCIYIDPPYNTFSDEWVYNDSVNSPMMKEWLGKVVNHEDLSRHDKWLCMMMPRLTLLKELLRDDGVIFISIDDNEQSHLRMLMDEIFGEENFIATFVWKRRASSAMADKLVSRDHEYVLCYGRQRFEAFQGLEKDYKGYSNPDNDPRGDWTTGDLTVGMTKSQRPNQFYDLIDPKTGNVYSPNPKRVWSYIPESMKQLLDEDRIKFPEAPNGKPMLKRFKSELKTDVNPLSTWIEQVSKASSKQGGQEGRTILNTGLNSEGTKVVQQIFGDKVFDYPKPPSLVKSLISQVCDKDDIILDSFAGSGTTAQSVLELNKEDGGNRRFILIEMEDYADNITAERIRRVIKGISSTNDKRFKGALGGTFSYFTLGDPIEMESILHGEKLPSYEDLARYVFYQATGEQFDAANIDRDRSFIGESKDFEVYLFYQPDIDYLKSTALTLERAEALGNPGIKKRLVFAPMKFLDQEYLHHYKIEFSQLPFEIYKFKD